MKIAFDHQVFGFQKHGGVSRYFSELIANLSQCEDLDVTVLAPLFVNQYLLRPSVRAHVRGRYFPWSFRGNATVVRALNALLVPMFWTVSRFDLIHETYYSRQAHGRARLRVLTIYDMIHELFPQEFPNSAQVTAAKRAAVARADHIICISETTRQDAIRLLGIAPERSSVTYLGCSLDEQAENPKLIESVGSYFLYVGQRGGYKNFRVVLEAMGSSAALKRSCHLVAFGGGAFSVEELQEIERRALKGRVLQGAGNDSLLAAHYRAATALVYPSRYEGFGIPPLEAMANGCPVICSNAGSLSEILAEAAAYFLPDDSAKLRALMERVANDRQYADCLRTSGLAQVKKYSWAKCAGETARTYRLLAN